MLYHGNSITLLYSFVNSFFIFFEKSFFTRKSPEKLLYKLSGLSLTIVLFFHFAACRSNACADGKSSVIFTAVLLVAILIVLLILIAVLIFVTVLIILLVVILILVVLIIIRH